MSLTVRVLIFAALAMVLWADGSYGVRLAFVYPGAIDDFGWNFAHEAARVALEETQASTAEPVRTFYASSVAPNQVVSVVEDFINDGAELIFLCGSQFQDQIIGLAPDHPTVRFVIVGSLKTAPNVASVYGRIYQTRYLAGMLCALTSKTGTVGYVASVPLPAILRSINAFYLGAQSINPNIAVDLVWTNNFSAPLIEKFALRLLADRGVDCVSSHTNDNTVDKLARDLGISSIGYASDVRYSVGETVLTSAMFDWFPAYSYFTRNVINGTWVPNESVYYGIENNAVFLAHVSRRVNESHWNSIVAMSKTLETNDEIFCGTGVTGEFPSASFTTQGCLNDSALFFMDKLLSPVNLVASLSESDVIKELFVSRSSAFGVITMVIIVILILITLALLVDVIIFRNHRVYKRAATFFCYFILIGALVGYVSIIFWLGRPTDANCMIRIWLGAIAYGLVYSNLLAKNWRLYRVTSSAIKQERIVRISNMELVLKWVLPIVAVELIIVLIWQLVDPQIVLVNTTSALLAEDEVNVQCYGEHSYFVIIFICFQALLLIPCIFLSYSTRHNTKEFKESQAIGLSIYNTLFCGILIIVLNLVLDTSVYVAVGVPVYGIIVILTTVVWTLFLPKAYRVHVLHESYQTSTGEDISTNKGESPRKLTGLSSGSDRPMNTGTPRKLTGLTDGSTK